MQKFIIAFLITLFFSSAFSQDTVRLSVEEAEQRFVSQNLELLAAKYEVDIAKAQVLQAGLWYNPNINYMQGLYDPISKKYFDASRSGEYYVQINQLKHHNCRKCRPLSRLNPFRQINNIYSQNRNRH